MQARREMDAAFQDPGRPIMATTRRAHPARHGDVEGLDGESRRGRTPSRTCSSSSTHVCTILVDKRLQPSAEDAALCWCWALSMDGSHMDRG